MGTPVHYRSVFLPDSLAIDTFYSSTVSTQLNLVWTEDQPLDASRFRPYYLPGDAPAWDGNGNAMENLWSGVLAGSAGDKAWYRTNDGFGTPHHFRSEEHTSELQSLMRISYAVFCLKKKKTKTRIQLHINKTIHNT